MRAGAQGPALGDPPGGWPEPFRTKALAGRTWKQPTESLTDEQQAALASDRRATLNELLFPGPTAAFHESRDSYGDLSAVSTIDYLYGLRRGEEHRVQVREGREMLFGLEAISEPDERGFRNVMATVDGQMRPVQVRGVWGQGDVPVRTLARHASGTVISLDDPPAWLLPDPDDR